MRLPWIFVVSIVLVLGASLVLAQSCGDGVLDTGAGEVCDPPGYSYLCTTPPSGGLGNLNEWGYETCNTGCDGYSICKTSRSYLQAGDIFSIHNAYFPAGSIDASHARLAIIDVHDYRVNRNNVRIDANVLDDKGNLVPNHTFQFTTGTTATHVISLDVDPDPAHALETGKTYTLELSVGHSPPIPEKITGNNHAKVVFTAITPPTPIPVPDQHPALALIMGLGVLVWLFAARTQK